MALFDSSSYILYSDIRFTNSDFALAWGDVDNDGINELLVSPFTITATDQPVFLRYTGTGFSDKNIIISDGGFPDSTGAGFDIFDIDNDGQKEVLFFNGSDQTLAIWKYSDGALRHQPGATITGFSDVAAITDISVARISDTNYLFAAHSTLVQVAIYNLSDPTAAPTVFSPLGAPPISGVSVRDIDCDGQLEMAVSTYTPSFPNTVGFFRLVDPSDLTVWTFLCDPLQVLNGAPFGTPQSVVFANLSDSCQWDLIVTDQATVPANIAAYKKSCDSILCFSLATGDNVPIIDTVCCRGDIVASWILNSSGATCSDDSDVGFITLTRPSDVTTVILKKDTSTVTFSFSDCQTGPGSLTFFRKCAFCSDFSDSLTIPLTFCQCPDPAHKIYWTNFTDNTLWVADISDLANPTTPTTPTLLMSDGNLKKPDGLFVDQERKNIYWVNFGNNTMWVGTIDDLANPTTLSNQKLLMSDSNLLRDPSGIFVDTTKRIVYWVNSGDDTMWFGRINDLSNPTTISDQTLLMSDGNLKKPAGLFVDQGHSKIYWVNYSDNTLWVGTISSDRANPTTPMDQKLLMSDGNLKKPNDLFVDTVNRRIYWVNFGDNSMWVGTISDLANPTTPMDQMRVMSSDSHLNNPSGIFVTTTALAMICPCTSPITISDLHGGPICAESFFDIFFSFEGVSDAHCTLTFNDFDYEADLFAGTNSFTVQAPSFASDYLAILSAYNLLNSDCSDVKTAIITVDAPVSVLNLAIISSDTVCSGTSVTLTATGDADHYLWFDGSDGGSHEFIPTQTSDYTVRGFSQNEACFSDASIHITVKQRPIVTVSVSSDTVCLGTAVTLTASGADTYSWFDGSDGSIHTFTPTISSDYVVRGTSDGCSSDASVHITVNTPVIVNAGSDQTIPAGSDAFIGVGPALSDVLYTWSPSDGISDIHAFPTTAHPSVATTYTVTAKRTDVSDCIASDSVVISTCLALLSDVQVSDNTLVAFLGGSFNGPQTIEMSNTNSDSIALLNPPFGSPLTLSDNGWFALATLSQSDSPFNLKTTMEVKSLVGPCVVTQNIQIERKIKNVVTIIITGSAAHLQLTLPSDLGIASSDPSTVFSNICNFAQTQPQGHIAGTMQVLLNSDMFASDSSILSGQQHVFLSCSDECLNIAQQSDQFLFHICSFTSDATIIYSDGNPTHAVVDKSIMITSITSQIMNILTSSSSAFEEMPPEHAPSSIPGSPSTLEMLFKALFILLGFLLFGMIFFPGF